jgi:hypothetical protein
MRSRAWTMDSDTGIDCDRVARSANDIESNAAGVPCVAARS